MMGMMLLFVIIGMMRMVMILVGIMMVDEKDYGRGDECGDDDDENDDNDDRYICEIYNVDGMMMMTVV
jgi:hypothetical protein